MKKTVLFLLGAVATFSMSAQVQLLKDAEKAMKSGKDYVVVYEMVKPAMSNSETANDVLTYYIPGKAGFNQFDKMIIPRQLGKDNVDVVAMANALLGGYDNFIKALPLDAVVDAKGKVKTKYTKEMHKAIADHYNDFTQAGVDFYNNQDYANALKAWKIFMDLSENPGEHGIVKTQPDSLVSVYAYYAGLSAYELDDKAEAARLFKKTTDLNPDNKDAWKNGLISALNANDGEFVLYFAQEGNKRYGHEDKDFIGSLINYYMQNQKYDEAISYLDSAIAADPDNAQYYVLKGILNEEKENSDLNEALNLYRKAVSVDPENGLANFQLGRAIYIDVDNMSNNFEGNQSQYEAFRQKELNPRYLEAIKYLENAYKYDTLNRSKALTILEQLYYLTNNEEGMNSVKERKLDDE